MILLRVIQWLGASTWRPAVGVAALLAVAALPVALTRPEAGTTDPDITGSVKAKVIGIIGGRFIGKPFMSRKAAPREQLRPGEVLLVRFRLGAPAAVHLEISGPKARLGVWADGRADSEPQPAMLPAGEHALVAQKQVMVIKAEDYGSPVRVVLAASPRPFAETPKPTQRCPDCSLDSLEVLPPPEGVQPPAEWR